MKILLTGASGTLGQDLLKIFREAGHEVLATDREILDITKKESVENFVQKHAPQLIINAAAYNFVDKVEDAQFYPLAAAVNIDGPKYLAISAAKREIPFVHYSTDYVFAGKKPEGYAENDEPDPISQYGKTKALGEAAVKAAGGMCYIFRLSKIFGTTGLTDMSKPSFVHLMLKLAKEQPLLKIIDEEVGCPTYTKDVAHMTLQLLTESYPGGIYHLINDGPGVTPYEFAEEIFAIAGVTTPRIPVHADAFPPRPAARPKFAALLNTKTPKLRSRVEALREFLMSHKVVKS